MHTLSRGGIPLKSSAEERASDFFMAFLISRTTKRDLQLGRSASPLSVPTQRKDTVFLLLHPCLHEGRAPKRSCHDTMGLLLVLLVLLLLLQALRHARRRQRFLLPDNLRGCDDPVENAATFECSSPPRISLRTTLRKDSTNSTRCRVDADPFFTCACLSFSAPDVLSRHCSSACAKCG